MIDPFPLGGSKLPRPRKCRSNFVRTPLARPPGMERGDDYYEEIAIEIDGWPWNVKERAPPRFPRAEKLLDEWARWEARRKLR